MGLKTKEENLEIYKKQNETMQRWLPVDSKHNEFKCVPGYEFYEEILEGDVNDI